MNDKPAYIPPHFDCPALDSRGRKCENDAPHDTDDHRLYFDATRAGHERFYTAPENDEFSPAHINDAERKAQWDKVREVKEHFHISDDVAQHMAYVFIAAHASGETREKFARYLHRARMSL